MKTTISLLLLTLIISAGDGFGQVNVHHNIITGKKVVIKNKVSKKVFSGFYY
jgi:hypothetical protein